MVWGDMLLERDNQNGLEYLTLATYAKKSNRANNAASTPSTALQTINGQNIKVEPGSGGGNSPAGSGRSTPRTKTGTQTSKLRAAAAAAAAAAAQESSLLHGGTVGKRGSLLSEHRQSVSVYFTLFFLNNES